MKVLVIGGSSGLGRATIDALNDDHYVINAAPSSIDSVENIALDLTSNKSINDFLSFVLEEHPDLGCVIHSAGLYQSDESLNIGFEEIDKIFLVNTTGVMKITNKLLPILEQNKGLLLVVGSVNVRKRNHLVYTPSKCALQAYVEYLQAVYREKDVRITILNPGLMNTQLFEHAGATRDKSDSMNPADVARVIRQVVDNTSVEFSEIVVQPKK